VFTNSGTFLGLIDEGGNLQSPWGLAYINQDLFGDAGATSWSAISAAGKSTPTVNLSQSEPVGQFLGPASQRETARRSQFPGCRLSFRPGLGDSDPHGRLLFTQTLYPPHPTQVEWNVSLYGMITPTSYRRDARPRRPRRRRLPVAALPPAEATALTGATIRPSAPSPTPSAADVYAITRRQHPWNTFRALAETRRPFQQISAATNSAGNAVVFGILGAGAGPMPTPCGRQQPQPQRLAMLSRRHHPVHQRRLNDDVYVITVAGETCGSTRWLGRVFQRLVPVDQRGLNDTGQAVVTPSRR